MFESSLTIAVDGIMAFFLLNLLLVFYDVKKAWLLLIVVYPLYNRFQIYFPSWNIADIFYLNYLTLFIFLSFFVVGIKANFWYPKRNLRIELFIVFIFYFYALISLQPVALLTTSTIMLSFILMRMMFGTFLFKDGKFKKRVFHSVFYSFLLSFFIMYLEMKRFGLSFTPVMITAMAYKRKAVIPGEYLSNTFSGGFFEPLQYAVWLVIIIPLFIYAYKEYKEKKYLIALIASSVLVLLIMERRPLLVFLLYCMCFMAQAKGYKFIIYWTVSIAIALLFVAPMLQVLMTDPFSHNDILFGVSIDHNAYLYIQKAFNSMFHLLEYPLGSGFTSLDRTVSIASTIHENANHNPPNSISFGFPVGFGGMFNVMGFLALLPVFYLARILFIAKGYWRYYLIPLSVGLFGFNGTLNAFEYDSMFSADVTVSNTYIVFYVSLIISFILADRETMKVSNRLRWFFSHQKGVCK